MYPTFLDANKPLPGAPEKRWRPQDIPSDDSSQELHNWKEVDAAPRLSRSFEALKPTCVELDFPPEIGLQNKMKYECLGRMIRI